MNIETKNIKSFHNPKISFKKIPKKEAVIKKVRENEILRPILEKLEFTDQEIMDSFANLVDYVNEVKNSENELFLTNIKRGYNDQIIFSKYLNPNSPHANEFKIANNLKLKYITSTTTKKLLNEIQSNSNSESGFRDLMQANNLKLIFNNQFKNFTLVGSSTSSRSLMLSALANQIATMDKTVAYLNINDLDTEIKSYLNKSNTQLEIRELIDSMLKLDVIILDEFGYKKFSNWFLEIFLDPLLSECIINKKTVIFGSYYRAFILFKHYFFRESKSNNPEKFEKNTMHQKLITNFKKIMCSYTDEYLDRTFANEVWIGNKEDR
ncbi:primosomal protein DnaI [Mycoplasmopsis mustelae]|uniref:Primosomal protein DnaI n=1 Tax=Mycoplasmopsis mustelae TaxID=171289 RepID=A0A4R7UD32_9BACT|nr:ATP-binding protein [Mycoplasmopsis mustelae]TDV23275.1 primosomal protein DnaI [Mycoplasmopsis mustelae]